VRVGFVGRFFPGIWRPPAEEIRFASENGFDAIQIRSDRPGMIGDDIAADVTATGLELARAGVECVVEMLLRYRDPVHIPTALRANLPSLHALGARRVHVHPAPGPHDEGVDFAAELAEAVEIAVAEGLLFGIEHNSREHPLFVTPESCAEVLAAVPGLSFVWDLNHTEPSHAEGFAALKGRLSLVHASDTPLPETNHHLPFGLGTVDVSMVCDVDVPVVLEIGGLPVSGGFGRDTDEALVASRAHLLAACT
jgi:L-ribulose-5-phosphate 3-epimerase